MGSSSSSAAEFLAILSRLGLNDVEAGVCIGVSPHTVRCVRLSGELPDRKTTLALILSFVARSRTAKHRGELRLAASSR